MKTDSSPTSERRFNHKTPTYVFYCFVSQASSTYRKIKFFETYRIGPPKDGFQYVIGDAWMKWVYTLKEEDNHCILF